MKKSIILLTIILTIFWSSCEDVLDRPPVSDLSEEKVFSDIRLFREYRNGLYNLLPTNHTEASSNNAAMSNNNLIAISDEGESMMQTGVIVNRYNDGDFWASSVEFTNAYDNNYVGIRRANKILENIGKLNDITDADEAENIEGEALFFRAFCHFELIKRYGALPYIEKALDINEDLNLARPTYDECVAKIIADCDLAIGKLPLNWDEAQFGRATKPAAMCLKATALIYNASPLNNTTNDKQRWEKAARAFYDVIALKNQSGQHLFTLMPGANYLDIFQKEMFEGNSEIIFSKVEGKKAGGSIANVYLPIIFASQWTGAAPTQNIADLFQMKNGRDITDPASGYQLQNPYTDRDPRFYHDFLYNGAEWMPITVKVAGKDVQKKEIEFWVSHDNQSKGRDIGPEGYSKTGYYFKKMWPYGFRNDRDNANPGITGSLPWFYYRLGGIYLFYAEAANEAFGPDSDGLGVGLTARQAVNIIRNRAGMPNVIAEYSTNQSQMREQIMKERAVELFGEGHRWYDGIRWKKAELWFNGPIYRMQVTKQADGTILYEKVLLENRVFTERNYRYPIPLNQINMNPNLVQNPGW